MGVGQEAGDVMHLLQLRRHPVKYVLSICRRGGAVAQRRARTAVGLLLGVAAVEHRIRISNPGILKFARMQLLFKKWQRSCWIVIPEPQIAAPVR